jgi:lysophospholipase L1-like esterase
VLAGAALLGPGNNGADAPDAGLTVTAADATTLATTAEVPTGASSAGRSVVGFGDSVASAAICRCTSFVNLYAKRLPGGAGVANYAESGSTSSDALDRLAESGVAAKVRTATTALIMTGANDFEDAFEAVSDGASAPARYGPVAEQVRQNVIRAVRKIQALSPHAHVVVLDYWAAMEDGDVAKQDYDDNGMQAATEATDYLNAALASAAKTTGASFVSTLKAFKGADGKTDPTPLLESDGDHPNAAGHRVIADAISAILPRG